MILGGVFGQTRRTQDAFLRLEEKITPSLQGPPHSFNKKGLRMIAGQTAKNEKAAFYYSDDSFLMGRVFPKPPSQTFCFSALKGALYPTDYLSEKCWGTYLYFQIDPRVRTLKILRDLTGQLPLFYLKLPDDGLAFSSDISVLYDLLEEKPSFNWAYLSSYLLHAFITSPSTIFNTIWELPHGCQLTVPTGKSQIDISMVWKPQPYSYPDESPEKTPQRLRETLASVMEQAIPSTDACLLDFSGGLDSSALLLMLHRLRPHKNLIKALNMFHPLVHSSDERSYAKSLAQKLGVSFIEFDHSHHLPLTPFPSSPYRRPNWPTSRLAYLKIDYEITQLVKEFPFLSYLSGHGGDHIFLCPSPIQSLADYLIQEGPRGFTHKLYQISSMGRLPFFTLMKETGTGLLKYFLKLKYKQDSIAWDKGPWLKQEIFDLDLQTPLHPLFSHPHTELLPGKFCHLDIIFNGLSTLKGNTRDPSNPIFYPLFSQPLIELALSIPTYLSYEKGYNRYPFREAISNIVAPELQTNLWRKDKGETTGIMQRGLQHNIKYVRELCLEGELAHQNLIDKDVFCKHLEEIKGGRPDYMWAFNNLVSLEIFFALWK